MARSLNFANRNQEATCRSFHFIGRLLAGSSLRTIESYLIAGRSDNLEWINVQA